jgi:hypothetical protein
VVVDAAGYRARREATLEALANRSAERAISSGRSVELDPMTAVEAQGRPPRAEGNRRRRHAQRGHRAEPLRRDRSRVIDRWLADLVADTRA